MEPNDPKNHEGHTCAEIAAENALLRERHLALEQGQLDWEKKQREQEHRAEVAEAIIERLVKEKEHKEALENKGKEG